mgnify:CR=1 FL=1|jgi:hypothetical protein
MAVREFNDVSAAVKNGSTWGTAADLTSGAYKMHFESIAFEQSRGTFLSTGNTNNVTDVALLEANASVTITANLAFHNGAIWQLIANCMGTSSTPAEQTASQGDELHVIDVTSSISGKFVTIAWEVETDQVVEIPSLKVTDFTISMNTNQVPTATIKGIASQVLFSGQGTVTNTAAELQALSLPTVEIPALGRTNHYFRLNTNAGGSLSSTDNKEILTFTWTFTRPLDESRTLRGASTPYSSEPLQLNNSDQTVAVTFDRVDDANQDPMTDLLNQTTQKAELYLDGNQIGSGLNTYMKFQFPIMKVFQVPGYSPTRGQRITAGYTWRAYQAGSAPTGMTGVTNSRITLVNRNTIDYR